MSSVPEAITETLVVNMGPQHPSTHGVLRVILELEGEVVRKATPIVGHLHRGVEKLSENRTYHQIIPIMDRMDYLAHFSTNLAYVLAVEKLLDLEVPPRAQVIRILITELTRIQSHLVWLGTHALDLGAITPLLYTFREREDILNIYEMVGGARMHTGYFRVGGVAGDLPPEFAPKMRAFIEIFPKKMQEYEALLTKNRIWMNRTQGVGIITAEDAIALGLSGPCLRACGVPLDLRKTTPYGGYEQFQFTVPTGTRADVYDRYLVRLEEMRQSLRIVEQAFDALPDGPVMADVPKVVFPPKDRLSHSIEALIHHFHLVVDGFDAPKGEIYQGVESPRGELGIYIASEGGPKPHRLKVRTPSFVNLESLATMAEGRLLSDMVAVIGSIDIVLGEVDR
jgi:NADH-quinone oxidoreductase subunit D